MGDVSLLYLVSMSPSYRHASLPAIAPPLSLRIAAIPIAVIGGDLPENRA
jgi:hypothetical protein